MKFRRVAQARWDARFLRTVSTHLTARQHRRLMRIAAHRGERVYQVVREFLLAYMDEWDPYNEFDDPSDSGEQFELPQLLHD